MTDDTPAPLDQLAKQIQRHLAEADKHDQKADDARLEAAMLLAEARRRVEAGESGSKWKWKEWCEHYIKRSARDVARLLKIGQSPDPKAAMEAERKKNREAVARHRERSAAAATTDVLRKSAPVEHEAATGPEVHIDRLEIAKQAYEALSTEQKAAFADWYAERRSPPTREAA